MEPLVVRPSLKPAGAWYAIATIALLLGVVLYNATPWFENTPVWLMLLPLVLYIIPVQKHLSTRLFRLEIGEDRLTLHRGLLSSYTRTIDLANIQDVTVRQSVWERLVGMGDVSLESAGEGGQLSIYGIDRPRQISEVILERARLPLRQRPAARRR